MMSSKKKGRNSYPTDTSSPENPVPFRYPKGIVDWLFSSVWNHLKDFWVVGVLMVAMLVVVYLFHLNRVALCVCEGLFVIYLLCRPMTTTYGLVGAMANLRGFLLNFFLVTCLFALVYWGFLRKAGICYDADRTIIDYSYNRAGEHPPVVDTLTTVYYEQRQTDSGVVCDRIVRTQFDTLHFNSVTFTMVLSNAFTTSFTQSPSDFFYAISDFSENPYFRTSDRRMVTLFSFTLLLHLIISWLFLGVFISLLYSKFRYEA